MFLPARKYVAVLMLLWLPLFSGNALAVSMVMQMPQGHCHEDMAGMSMDGMETADADQGAGAQDDQLGCSQCGICHLACSSYVAAPSLHLSALPVVAGLSAPYLVSFRSIASVPLLPPPLVRV